MSKPIAVGDLVVVAKSCCPAIEDLGKIFRVGAIRSKKTQCECGQLNEGAHAGIRINFKYGIPLQWLKRIPPLEELEGERTEEKLWEPA